MKILGVDSSGMVASVALVQDGITIAEYSVNYKKTHSQTLLPMLDEIVKMTEQKLEELDAIAVAAGPGSFTGLRIGAATVKGLGMALEKPIVAVPTCHALAYNMWGTDKLVCPIMDARRNQVYTGIYAYEDGEQQVLHEQDAMDIRKLIDILNAMKRPVVFLGDGVPVFKEQIAQGVRQAFSFAPAHMNRQRAAAVAALGECYFAQGICEDADSHKPIYLRKSQAEREQEQRKVKQTDSVLQWIAETEKACFPDAWSKKSLEETIQHDYNTIYLVYGNTNDIESKMIKCVRLQEYEGNTDKLKGYLICSMVAGESELLRIAVSPSNQGEGYGYELLRFYLQETAGGCERYLLEVRESNTAARHLYEKAGYRQMGNRRDYYSAPAEDAVLYEFVSGASPQI